MMKLKKKKDDEETKNEFNSLEKKNLTNENITKEENESLKQNQIILMN